MIKGKISEILPALKSGFISSGKGEGVFFSPVTELVGLVYEDLKINQHVHFEVTETMRGLLAIKMTASDMLP